MRLAVAAARERLIASYPRMDVAEARPRVPSFYALELPRAVEGRLPELKEFETARARSRARAPELARAARDGGSHRRCRIRSGDARRAIGKSNGARYLVEANPHLARSLRARWRRWASNWKEAGRPDHHRSGGAGGARQTPVDRARRGRHPRSSNSRFVLIKFRAARHLWAAPARRSGAHRTAGSADARRLVSRRAIRAAR